MKTVARLIFRPEEKGNPGLIIGKCIGENNPFKANHVYEIREILGQIVFQDKGPSHMREDCSNDDKGGGGYHTGVVWANEIGHIIQCSGADLLLTQKELNQVNGYED